MRPVTVSIDVPQDREEVFDFLDVLANHEQFTDHFLRDWSLQGPARGVGARARMRVKSPGPDDWPPSARRRPPKSRSARKGGAARAAPTGSTTWLKAARGSPSSSPGSRRQSANG